MHRKSLPLHWSITLELTGMWFALPPSLTTRASGTISEEEFEFGIYDLDLELSEE